MTSREQTIKDLQELAAIIYNKAETTETAWTRELIENLRRDFTRILRGIK